VKTGQIGSYWTKLMSNFKLKLRFTNEKI
jgi:hypothetical protein